MIHIEKTHLLNHGGNILQRPIVDVSSNPFFLLPAHSPHRGHNGFEDRHSIAVYQPVKGPAKPTKFKTAWGSSASGNSLPRPGYQPPSPFFKKNELTPHCPYGDKARRVISTIRTGQIWPNLSMGPMSWRHATAAITR